MTVRSALGTVLRFVAAVTGLYFVVALGLLLLVVAGRTVGGHYPVPSESAAGPFTDFALLLAVLAGSWFVAEGHSLRRLFAFAVSVWALFFAPVFAIAAVDSALGPFPYSSAVAGAFVVLVGVAAYLVAYRLVYPDSFAERKWNLGLGT